MVSRDTKTTAAFVVLAIVLWVAVSAVTANQYVQWGVLIGVGVILPMAIDQWRE